MPVVCARFSLAREARPISCPFRRMAKRWFQAERTLTFARHRDAMLGVIRFIPLVLCPVVDDGEGG